MPHERRQFENEEVYHLTLRRTGNELMFGDIHDYYRAIFSIYEFNNANPVRIDRRRKERAQFKEASKLGQPLSGSDKGCPSKLLVEEDKRDRLVDILAFCFMPNHIHLLVKQIKDGGVSQFMLKFGSGYATYFKKRYNQNSKGYFFDNRFHSVYIKDDRQLQTAFVYVHANPISLVEPNWKKVGVRNIKEVIEFIEGYKWSSYQDYLGIKNFTSVTERDFLLREMGSVNECRQAVNHWIETRAALVS